VTRRALNAALSAVFGLAVCLVISATAAASPVPSGFVGMNLDGPIYPDTAPGIDLAQQFARMQAAGVTSVRAVFNWAAAQPYANWSQVPAGGTTAFVNDGGIPTDFTSMDEIVGLAASAGDERPAVVIYAPLWDVRGQTRTIDGRPATDGPYANFLTDLVARYGPRGSFWRGRSGPIIPIRRWQIWNEPTSMSSGPHNHSHRATSHSSQPRTPRSSGPTRAPRSCSPA